MNKVPISPQASAQTIEVGITSGLPKNTASTLIQDEQFLAKNVVLTENQVQMDVMQDGRWQTLRLTLAPPKPKPATLNEAMVKVSDDGKTLTFTAAPKSIVIADTKPLLSLYSQLTHGTDLLPKQTPVVLKDAQTLSFPKLNLEFHIDKQTMALLRQETRLVALVEPTKTGLTLYIVSQYSDPLVKLDIAKKHLVSQIQQQLPELQLRSTSDELQIKYTKRGIPTLINLATTTATEFASATKWTPATLKSFADRLSLNTYKQEFSALLQHSIKQHLPNITRQTEHTTTVQNTLLDYQSSKLPSMQDLKQAVSYAIDKWIKTPFASLRPNSHFGQLQKLAETLPNQSQRTSIAPRLNASLWLAEPLLLSTAKEQFLEKPAMPRLFDQIRTISQQLGNKTQAETDLANKTGIQSSPHAAKEPAISRALLNTVTHPNLPNSKGLDSAHLVSQSSISDKNITDKTVPNTSSNHELKITQNDSQRDKLLSTSRSPSDGFKTKSTIQSQDASSSKKTETGENQALIAAQRDTKHTAVSFSSSLNPDNTKSTKEGINSSKQAPLSQSIQREQASPLSMRQFEPESDLPLPTKDKSVSPKLTEATSLTEIRQTKASIPLLTTGDSKHGDAKTTTSTANTVSAQTVTQKTPRSDTSPNLEQANIKDITTNKNPNNLGLTNTENQSKSTELKITALNNEASQPTIKNTKREQWHAPLLPTQDSNSFPAKLGKIERMLLGLNDKEQNVDKALSLSQSVNEIKATTKSLPIDLQRMVNQAFERMWDEKTVHPIAVQQHVSAITNANVSSSPFLQALDKIIVTFLAGSKLNTNLPDGVSSEQRLQTLLTTLYPNHKASNIQQLLAALSQNSALDSLTSELSKVQTQFQHVSNSQLNTQQSSEHNWLLNLFLPTKNTADQRQTELQIGKYKKPAKAHLPEKTVWFVRLNFDLAPVGTLAAQAELMDKAVDCSLVAENSAVKSLAKPHLTALRERLAAHGLQVGDITLSEDPEKIAQFYSSHAIVNVKV